VTFEFGMEEVSFSSTSVVKQYDVLMKWSWARRRFISDQHELECKRSLVKVWREKLNNNAKVIPIM
jgi:hypothetical protein